MFVFNGYESPVFWGRVNNSFLPDTAIMVDDILWVTSLIKNYHEGIWRDSDSHIKKMCKWTNFSYFSVYIENGAIYDNSIVSTSDTF